MGSGTTLLALLLGQRFESAGVVTESARQISRGSALYMPRTDSYPSVAALMDGLRVSNEWDEATARSDLVALYRSRAFRDSPWIVDKGPNANLVRATFLKRLFPQGRFAMIFRDPVANVEGIRRKWTLFGRSPLAEAIDFYRFIHESFLDQCDAFGDDCRIIDYDDMVTRDADYLAGLGDWLGLGASSSALPMRDRPNVRGRGVRAVKGKQIAVVKGASGEAYDRLEPKEVAEIQAGTAELMERLRGRVWSPPPI